MYAFSASSRARRALRCSSGLPTVCAVMPRSPSVRWALPDGADSADTGLPPNWAAGGSAQARWSVAGQVDRTDEHDRVRVASSAVVGVVELVVDPPGPADP